MKPINAKLILGLASLLAAASSQGQIVESGWYVGGNIGESRSKLDHDRMAEHVLGGGVTIQSITSDDSDTGFKVFGGYRLNRNLALESGYFDLGKSGFVAWTTPAGTLNGSIKVRGVNIDAVGSLPFSARFSGFARVGVHYAQTRDAFTGNGAVSVLESRSRKDGANVKYGLGLQYDFTKELGMRLEAERYRVSDAVGGRGDVDLISLGLIYRFGAKDNDVVARAPFPVTPSRRSTEPAVTMVEQSPVPTPEVRPLEPGKVAFSSDAFFESGQAALNQTGKAMLDQFAANLKVTDYEVITITGHADRIGTDEDNMTLSVQRARVVKDYLVESGGVPARKISATGVSEGDPVTPPGSCMGKKSPAVVACLQADRRVVVEVLGTEKAE